MDHQELPQRQDQLTLKNETINQLASMYVKEKLTNNNYLDQTRNVNIEKSRVVVKNDERPKLVLKDKNYQVIKNEYKKEELQQIPKDNNFQQVTNQPSSPPLENLVPVPYHKESKVMFINNNPTTISISVALKHDRNKNTYTLENKQDLIQQEISSQIQAQNSSSSMSDFLSHTFTFENPLHKGNKETEIIILHGETFTRKAIENQTSIRVKCMNFHMEMHLTQEAKRLYCPLCHFISPLKQNYRNDSLLQKFSQWKQSLLGFSIEKREIYGVDTSALLEGVEYFRGNTKRQVNVN